MATIGSVDTVFDGWGRLHLIGIREDDGSTYTRQVEDHGNAVAVLPFDPLRGFVILVRQMRAPALFAAGTPALLEAPAGMLENEAHPADCARREAEEEVGLRLRDVQSIGRFWTMPGTSTERMELFLAEYGEADRVSAGGGLEDENERIEVLEVPIRQAVDMLARGELADLKTLALFQALQLRRPELFDRSSTG